MNECRQLQVISENQVLRLSQEAGDFLQEIKDLYFRYITPCNAGSDITGIIFWHIKKIIEIPMVECSFIETLHL